MHDDVGISSERRVEGLGLRPCMEADVALADEPHLPGMNVLNRLLNRGDVLRRLAIDEVDEGGDGARLAVARGAGDDDEAAVVTNAVRDHLGETERGERGHLLGDDPERELHARALP